MLVYLFFSIYKDGAKEEEADEAMVLVSFPGNKKTKQNTDVEM